MKSKGYVSSFDRESGFGFVRPQDAPGEKVMFRRHALSTDDSRSLLPGNEVFFEIDPALDEPSPWKIAGSVELVGEAGD